MNLRDQAHAIINGITVSHKPLRKPKGALHEETLYGLTQEKNEKGDEFVVLRKYIKDLKPKDLNDIRDLKKSESCSQGALRNTWAIYESFLVLRLLLD